MALGIDNPQDRDQERRSPALAPPASRSVGLGARLPKIMTSTETMDKAREGLISEQEDLQRRIAPLQANVEARRADFQGASEAPVPGAPKLRDIPQFQPRQLSGEDMTLFAGVAMALAGLGTRAMRGDITMALNAAGSAFKGFNEGNLQQSKLDMEQFRRSMDSVIAENHKMSEEYRSILENRKLSLQQKEQALRVAASSRDDQVMLSGLKSGQLKTIFDLEAHRIDATNRLSMQAYQIQTNADLRAQMLQLQRDRINAAKEKADAQKQSGLSPEATEYLSAYVQLNGRMPIGMSRQNPMAIETMNSVAKTAAAAGLTPSQWAAAGPITHTKLSALTDFQKKRANIQAFEGMMDANIEILRDLSKKVERADQKFANKSILWLKNNASDNPTVAEYLFQVNTVQVEIARVLNNPNLTGELSDSARHELQGVLDGSLAADSLDRVLTRAQSDARNRSKSMDKQADKLIKEIQNPLGNTATDGALQAYPTEAAARAAGKRTGDRVIINGVTGTLTE